MSAEKKINNKPLYIFIIIGILLFTIDYLIDKPEDNIIKIDDNTVNHLLSSYLAGKNADSLDNTTINSLVKNYIESEIFYREALSLGLDKDDPIIKNRLIQKYQFLNQDEGPAKFSDRELVAYYQSNIANYSQSSNIRFKHLFFSFDKRKDAYSDVSKTFMEIKSNIQLFDRKKEDIFPITVSTNEYLSKHEISRLFGKKFTDMLFSNPRQGMLPPIESGLGYHIVNILEVQNEKPIPFEEVKHIVVEDLRNEIIHKNERQHIQQLRKQYEVEFDLFKYKTTIEQR